MARKTGFLERLLGVGERAAPPAFKAPFTGGRGLAATRRRTTPGLRQARTGGFPSFSIAGGREGIVQAEEYAATDRIAFNDPYWRKQAEAMWGKATAKKLAQLNRESAFTKKSAKQNLDLALERIGQDRAFAGEDIKATLEQIAAEHKWNKAELAETIENIDRMRGYLKEDFENTVTELAYQRGVQREDIAQTLMPLGEKVREEAWERGLGGKGLGSREARNVAAIRTQQIKRAKAQEEFGVKAAGITKTRGLEEASAQQKRAERVSVQRGEEIGFRGDAARRSYSQALQRYGLEEKGARVGYGQEIGAEDIRAGGIRTGLEERRRIGVEEFTQARRGEAYARAAADPYAGIRTVRTPVRRTSPIPRITTTRRRGGSAFGGGRARRSRDTSILGRLRRLF